MGWRVRFCRGWVGDEGWGNGNHETHEISRKGKEWELGRGFVGFYCFVGFRDFRGCLDRGVDRYGAKVAKGRKGRGDLGVKRNAEARRAGRKTLRVIGWKMSRAKSRRREGRGIFGVSERAPLKKLCGFAALREAFFPLTVDGSRWTAELASADQIPGYAD